MIKLVILDVDGVLTDGKKYYDNTGKGILKTFCDRDFTAIKKFKASGVNIIFLSGDKNINKQIANNRNIDFYYSRGKCKSLFLDSLKGAYKCNEDEIAFVGDDIFDLELMKIVKYKFCPKNADEKLLNICSILKSTSGSNCVSEVYDRLVKLNLIKEYKIEKIYKLDSYENF